MISPQRNLRRIAMRLAMLAVALNGILVFGQFETATLTGVVTDSAGAVVPSATVKAINEATNIEATVTRTTKAVICFRISVRGRTRSLPRCRVSSSSFRVG